VHSDASSKVDERVAADVLGGDSPKEALDGSLRGKPQPLHDVGSLASDLASRGSQRSVDL